MSSWKSRAARAAILAGFLPIALSALGTLPLAADPISPLDELAITNLMRSYTESWLTGQHRHVLKHFHDDAILIPHHGVAPVEGIRAIRDFWWPVDGPETGVTRFEIVPAEIYGEADLAYLRGRFVLEYWVGEGEEKKSWMNEGNWLGIFTRNAQDRWLIRTVMWNDPLPRQTDPEPGPAPAPRQ